MTDLLQIARERRQLIEQRATKIDDFALNIEIFLQGAQKNRAILAEDFEHIDEFLLYSEYILQTVTDRLEELLKEARKLDEFISYGEYLLRTDPDAEPEYPATKKVGPRQVTDDSATESEISWLNDVVRHAQERGARAARERSILHARHPFDIQD